MMLQWTLFIKFIRFAPQFGHILWMDLPLVHAHTIFGQFSCNKTRKQGIISNTFWLKSKINDSKMSIEYTIITSVSVIFHYPGLYMRPKFGHINQILSTFGSNLLKVSHLAYTLGLKCCFAIKCDQIGLSLILWCAPPFRHI